MGPVGSVVLPVGGGQLDELDRVRLNVDSCKNRDVSMPVEGREEICPRPLFRRDAVHNAVVTKENGAKYAKRMLNYCQCGGPCNNIFSADSADFSPGCDTS